MSLRFPLASFLAATAAAALAAQSTVTEEPLEAGPGWSAWRIHRGGGGVWYARVEDIVPQYGAADVLVADDDGMLSLLTVYSGNWTARSVNPDGQWLAPSRPADVDPRVPGRELYAAGRGGNVHRIRLVPEARGRFRLDSVEIAHVPAEEFHTVVADDLDPSRAGDELLVFGISGRVFELRPSLRDGDPSGTIFTVQKVADLGGRVRDAVVWRPRGGGPPRLIGAARSGELLLMTLDGAGLQTEVLAREDMGLGRVAMRPTQKEGPAVVYATRDDGVVLRFELADDGRALGREAIYAGAQGLRGIAAGRFHDEPGRESIAVYGYGAKVQLVSRAGSGAWSVETIHAGDGQGHWLTRGELDGRNGTDELIATGFAGDVVLLARKPGYGLQGVALEPEPEDGDEAQKPRGEPARGSAARPWRLAVRAAEIAIEELSPLRYQGGFETKSMVYETLVRRGPDGRIIPGLAASWSVEDGGRSYRFRLREGASFHDGEPVTPEAVVQHFRRWVGLPEHDWLRSNRRIVRVEALPPAEVRVTLDRPHALLPDLCAINPTAIRGPGALDREGNFVAPIGSGPFAFDGLRDDGRTMRFRRHAAGPARFVDLVRLDALDLDPLDALLRDEVDAVLGSWLIEVDTKRVAALRADPRFQVLEAPGSSVLSLGFRREGPTADPALRARIAAAIDRAELIRIAADGLADPTTAWAAPSVAIWPQGTPPSLRGGPLALTAPLRLAAGRRGGDVLADAIAAQLARAGIATVVVRTPDGEPPDLRIDVTHGVPYDPYTTLVSRFTPPISPKTAESARFRPVDPALIALVEKATATADGEARARIYAEIQDFLDADVTLVPLFAPRRIAVLRADMPAPKLDHDMYRLDARWLFD